MVNLMSSAEPRFMEAFPYQASVLALPVTDIDAAVRYGLGSRWTLMGPLLTLHLAGGAGGMKGILDHAGSAIQEWWTPRTATFRCRRLQRSSF